MKTKIAKCFGLAAASLYVLAGCGGGVDAGTAGAGAGTEADLTAGKLIPQLVQYEGKFDDKSGTFGAVQLLRDGTYRHFDPHSGVSTGKILGPTKPVAAGAARKIKLGTLAATITETRETTSVLSHALLTVTLASGSTVALVSEYTLVGETECGTTGGQWTDDDQDPKTGLFCVCKSPKMFTNAGGGCGP